ncbi:Ribonuclease H-like protein [Gracilaria domingensis]|nr:Ribonuclease H-like protein [Gracilaria domingensis]
MGYELSLSADQHYSFLTFVRQLNGKMWKNVVALIGDNCDVNKATADQASSSLIGCASHRFNLAVRDEVSKDTPILMKIHKLMVKLRTLLAAAQLKIVTKLKPKLHCPTLWRSTFLMLSRYVKLRLLLGDLGCSHVDELIPSVSKHRRIQVIWKRLEELQSVSLELLKESTTLSDVWALFDETINEYPAYRRPTC